jgi:D-alanine-D-alanine ligase
MALMWRFQDARYRIAVLAGGDSAERDVSLQSGAHVAAALAAAGNEVELFDPCETPLAQIPWKHFDVCFIALHGGAGEDGRLQRRLELLKVPYTGSGPAPCRLAMSKSASKERFLQAGVPTKPYLLFHLDEPIHEIADRLGSLEYPLIVKPDSQGSSLGVRVVHERGELADALRECRRYDDYGIAEPRIDGRELTVSLLGRIALPVLEIVHGGSLFDYTAKYSSPATEYRFETGLPDRMLEEIQQIAAAAAESLGTRGLVRVDLMLDADERPWVLEVNTVPGLTAHSLAPKGAERIGLGMAELCHWMIQDCLSLEVAP